MVRHNKLWINAVNIFIVIIVSTFMCQSAQAAYTINLNAGWNLIALPEQPEDTNIIQVTNSISGKFNSVWAYSAGWTVYDPQNPDFSDLSTMEAGRGYWIAMNEPGSLTGAGTSPSQPVSLNSGWNLVGYNSNATRSVSDSLFSIAGKYLSVWAYANSLWQVYDPLNPDFSDLSTMGPGIGYWINTTELCQWNCDSVPVFLGTPLANPDSIFINEAINVRFTQSIAPNPYLDPPSVMLSQVEGNALASPVLMYDDGDLQHGDDIQADGVFSCIVSLNAAAEGQQGFRVQAKTTVTEQIFSSQTKNILAVAHMTTEQVNNAINIANDAENVFDEQFAQNGGNTEVALTETLNQLNSNPNILQAGISENSGGVWWINTDGTLGGMAVKNDSETLAGSVRGSVQALPDIQLKNNLEGVDKFTASPENAIFAAEPTKVGSKKTLVFGAYFYNDVVGQIETILKNSQCPNYDITTIKEGNCSVDFFKTLHNYGIVAGVTHGETFYNGILSLWADKWKWNYIGGQVVLFTNTTLTDQNKALYEADIKNGRLAVFPGGLIAVLPSFISYYNSGFPNSLVYIASCRGTYNDSLANAFLNAGAKTFFGYSEYVYVTFAGQMGTNLFTELVNNKKTTGEAFVPNQHDTNVPPAYFQMRGDNNLSISDSELINGGFEKGNLDGWSKSGDGRVITQLGGAMPTEGGFMGIISTGLGFTTSSGSITQAVCVPTLPQDKTTITLKYDWNFFSEEFKEYCGSIYQDFFSVDLIGQNLQYNDVDSLCSSVSASDVSFDRGGVYDTGWQSKSIDVTTLAGTSGLLIFSAGDVGDSIYDTAILIDNVRFVAE